MDRQGPPWTARDRQAGNLSKTFSPTQRRLPALPGEGLFSPNQEADEWYAVRLIVEWSLSVCAAPPGTARPRTPGLPTPTPRASTHSLSSYFRASLPYIAAGRRAGYTVCVAPRFSRERRKGRAAERSRAELDRYEITTCLILRNSSSRIGEATSEKITILKKDIVSNPLGPARSATCPLRPLRPCCHLEPGGLGVALRG